jgi:hypothetical protein
MRDPELLRFDGRGSHQAVRSQTLPLSLGESNVQVAGTKCPIDVADLSRRMCGRPTETSTLVGRSGALPEVARHPAGFLLQLDGEPPQNSRHSGMSLNTGAAQTGGTAPCLDR